MKRNIVLTLIVLLAVAILLPAVKLTHSMPIDEDYLNDDHSGEYNGRLDEETKEQVRQCEEDQTAMELCMRCAKITKSTTVYPLCCGNVEGVKEWCYAYVYYRVEPQL
ncbi:uncharacterized protein LOC101901173 [Musca domestica]|uniref:Uncharacterized protein LOC101901173 isoform X1 n=1 Tax=Musca domestica TaxID=7370 RepID=A0A1I8MVE2_MUSDO|nr:uncharacterized protein LOC101901173 [Musca domestica]